MHGEYKVPGGKLVVADLDIIDDQLRNVLITGDFFLEPETTLATLTASLEGMPSDATEADLAARIAEASQGSEMLGITPEGVAVAVRRAVGGAS